MPSTLEGASNSGSPAPAARRLGDRWRPVAPAAWRDPFRRQRARYGPTAGFLWWHRLGAALSLAILVGILGVMLAALVGFLAFVGGIALEALIG